MNHDMEFGAVGALLNDNQFAKDTGLESSHFNNPIARKIWDTSERLINDGEPVDSFTVLDHLNDREYDYITNCVDNAWSKSLSKVYAESLIKNRQEDRVKELGHLLIAEPDRADEVINELRNINTASSTYSYKLNDVLKATIDHIDKVARGEIKSISTGIDKLDGCLGGFHDSDLVVLAARPAMGKELHKDSKILTARDGWKKISAIRVGDSLASIDGKQSTVTGHFPQGKKELFRVTLKDGRSVLAGLEHQWEVMYRDWAEPRVVTTKKLIGMLQRKRYQKRLSIPLFNGIHGANTNHKIHPYVIGALLGDGCLSKKKGGVHFSSADTEIVERANSFLPNGYQLKHTANYDYRLNTGGERPCKVRKECISLGIYGCLSEDKFIPETYLDSDRETRVHVLNGLMDTDGWVEKSGSVVFCSASKVLANDVMRLVRSLGGVAKIRRKENAGLGCYVVNIQHHSPKEIFTLPRKVERTRTTHTHAGKPAELRLTISAIEKECVDDAYCISVSHDRALYITEDFIVTHNTALMLNMLLKTGVRSGVFSCEMGNIQLGSRLLTIDSGVEGQKIRQSKLDDLDYSKLFSSVSHLKDAPIWINDQPAPTLKQLISQARKWKLENDIQILFIDYLQRIKLTGNDPRHLLVGEAARQLKELARDLDIPVVVLAQVNRQADGQRPNMSHLAQSGEIEAEADQIMFLYRDEVYNENSEFKGIAEILIEKNRHGATGGVRTAWIAPAMQFKNLSEEWA